MALLATVILDVAGPLEKVGTVAEGPPSPSRLVNFWQLQDEVLADAAQLQEDSQAAKTSVAEHGILALDKLAAALELGAEVSRKFLGLAYI